MKCCPCCFIDPYIRKSLPALVGVTLGKCDYCGSNDVPLVPPSNLRDLFSPVVAIYEKAETGKQLVDCLQEDWQPFNVAALGPQGARSLLADVLDDGELVRSLCSISSQYLNPGLHQLWESLKEELISRNRYFPEHSLGEERFTSLLYLLKSEGAPTVWYRSRVQQTATPYLLKDMGAPPPWTASHGRANPPGIPYLYLASNKETSVAEIRPHTGELVSVAEFHFPDTLNLVDLRAPRRSISPFVIGDEDRIGAVRSDIPFLEKLGEELTRPVVPHRAAVDYVPSQYVCELIKKNGWDGVIYNSSVGSGINVALFDPTLATGVGVSQMQVSKVTVSVQ